MRAVFPLRDCASAPLPNRLGRDLLTNQGKSVKSIRETLLMRLRHSGDPSAWSEFIDIYQPLLTRYARARGLGDSGAKLAVAACLAAIQEYVADSSFKASAEHFKQWVARRTVYAVEQAVSGNVPIRCNPSTVEATREGPSPDDEFERIWSEEHRRHGLNQLRAETDFKTFEAFHRIVVDGWSLERVSEHYELNPEYVRAMMSRLTRRLEFFQRGVLGE